MAAKKRSAPQVKTEVTLHTILEELLSYITESVQSKPANPATWARLERLNDMRKDMQQRAGEKPTDIPGLHGSVQESTDTEDGK